MIMPVGFNRRFEFEKGRQLLICMHNKASSVTAFGSPYQRATEWQRTGKSDQRRVDTSFGFLKSYTHREPSIENCSSPTREIRRTLGFLSLFLPVSFYRLANSVPDQNRK
jgi:hypothetical protein